MRHERRVWIIIFLITLILVTIAGAGLPETSGSFFEGFESGSFSTNNWTLASASGANNWTIETTNPYNGTYYAQARPRSTSEPASVMQTAISTAGYTNITFSYYRRLIGLDSADEFKAKWYNGTSWVIVEETLSNSADNPSYVYKSFSLPASSDNNPNFKIRFECTAGAASEYCRVDDIRVRGSRIPLLNNPPNTALISPADGDTTASKDVNFICNAVDDVGLANITFYWDYLGLWEADETVAVAGASSQTTFERTDLDNGIIMWNCLVCDNISQCSFAPANWTITVNYTAPDTIPPSSITNLANQSAGTAWIYWTWTNPVDIDFNSSIIYINSIWKTNTSVNFYNATGLNEGTEYTITIHTKT